jgi:hypothetical protein
MNTARESVTWIVSAACPVFTHWLPLPVQAVLTGPETRWTAAA